MLVILGNCCSPPKTSSACGHQVVPSCFSCRQYFTKIHVQFTSIHVQPNILRLRTHTTYFSLIFMNIIKTNIPGVLIIEPRVFKDSRGYFFESFSQREFDEKVTPILGHSINFVQDNESMSSYSVMRGLHYQRMPYTQSKLVRCVKGAVLDVAVDIRKGSPTFGQHVSCLLTGRDEEGMKIAEQWEKESLIPNSSSLIGLQFFIPRGFAHGFAMLSETAVFQYK